MRKLSCLALLAICMAAGQARNVAGQELTYDKLNPIQKRLLSGFADYQLNPENALKAKGLAQGLAKMRTPTTSQPNYVPGRYGCSEYLGDNVKVNQNCLNLSDSDFQGGAQSQNETSIAADPSNPNHIVAAYNDYRQGDGYCGVSYSLDGGRTWLDSTLPAEVTRGEAFGAIRQYWQAGGDPSVAWDTQGNAYLTCLLFQRGKPPTPNPDQSSGIYVFRSTQNSGASWNFTGRPVIEAADVAGTIGVFVDKQYMTIDNHKESPFKDRVYVTWTEFASDGTAYIWESYSNDYGEHFSAKVLVSAENSSLCTFTFGLPIPHGACNENQDSQPFTGPDGALYVVWSNYSNSATGSDNRNQVLLAKSTDGGISFSTPVKVSDFYDLPDCFAYQGKDLGRACVPEKDSTTNSYFRANNYSSGAVNPTNPQQVVVSLGSYINSDSKDSNCVPSGFSARGWPLYTGVKSTPGCKNAILLSVSNDAGATFSGATTDPRQLLNITSTGAQKSTNQWWQWATFSPGGKLAVSYYDRQYGNDETTGFMDISVSASRDLSKFVTVRATSSSNPPPTQFGGLFMGDYSGVTAVDVGNTLAVYPFWTDTRNSDLFLCPDTGTPDTPPTVCTASASNASVANDQDVFTRRIIVPIP